MPREAAPPREAAEGPGRVAVVGGGTMGTGIAYVFAAAGFQTALVEPDDGRAEVAREALAAAAAEGKRRGKLTDAAVEAITRGVTRHAGVETLARGLDLVIETVPERLALKRDVLSGIAARDPGIIATNTSALSIDELAASVSDRSAFLGMHFFNPVWSLPLVELVRGRDTDEAVMDRAAAMAEATGKTVVRVSDTPGFATSRLDLIAAMEAIRMVEDGVATADDIDRAMVTAYRHPIGPLRLSDIVGLDVRLDIARSLATSLGPRYAPPALLADMVARGQLGRKSGRGFYDWTGEGR